MITHSSEIYAQNDGCLCSPDRVKGALMRGSNELAVKWSHLTVFTLGSYIYLIMAPHVVLFWGDTAMWSYTPWDACVWDAFSVLLDDYDHWNPMPWVSLINIVSGEWPMKYWFRWAISCLGPCAVLSRTTIFLGAVGNCERREGKYHQRRGEGFPFSTILNEVFSIYVHVNVRISIAFACRCERFT